MLGGFGVDRDGQPIHGNDWRLRKARTLVKLLALAPDQRLHRDVLLDVLWPDRDPASAMNNLHQALYVARRVLAGDGSSKGWLELRDDMVMLLADGVVDVDVQRFLRLASVGRASGDLADLRAAAAAYGGDLLPEDRFEEWAARPREELRETMCDVLVDLADTAAAAGGNGAGGYEAEALEALERALAADPLHERAVRGLMRRLAEAGRRSEALARYERLRSDLREMYGTDPDPDTVRLYRDLLAGSQDPGPRSATPSAPSGTSTPAPAGSGASRPEAAPSGASRPEAARPESPRSNIPPMLTSFVGREREIADVRRLLARAGLLTLTGVGGVGKTRLAEQIGLALLDSYPDGVWITDLVPVSEPALVADTVAAAVGLDPAGASDPVRRLAARLADRKLLLVLDNCEHVLAACTALVSEVRRRCPGVTVLATSREPLRVPGEVTFRVPSLELPEPEDTADIGRLGGLASVRLFVDRASDARPGFMLAAGNMASIVEICRRLDGIPLALELAAARVTHLAPAEIAERLTEALSLLSRRGEVTRHATLRAALEWSYALLSADEQVLLRRLSVFAGGFSLASAERVCADDRLPRFEVLDCLGRLVDKSLVHVEHEGAHTRYRLLETVRQLAHERLAAASEVATFEGAHCEHFLVIARTHDPDRASGVIIERPQSLDVDHDNLRAALAWALRSDHDRALLLGVSLWRYWLARGHFVEGTGWLERVLAVNTAPSQEKSRALLGLAILHARRGFGDRLPALGDASVQVAAESGDRVDVVYARVLRGTLLLNSVHLDGVEAAATEAVDEANAMGAAPVVAAARSLAAMVALFREDAALARQRFTDCLRDLRAIDETAAPFVPVVTMCLPLVPVGASIIPVFEESWLIGRRVGAVQGHAYMLSNLADAHRLAGDLDSAVDAAQRSVDAFADIDDAAGLAHALNHLGCIERDHRRFDLADKHLREALRLREQLGDRRGENLSLGNLGLLCAAAGDLDDGRRLARLARDLGDTLDDGPGVAGALLNLAVVELFADEPAAARVFVEQAVEAFAPQGYVRLDAWARLLAAELAAGASDQEVVVRHGRTAAALFAHLGCRIAAPRVAALRY
jgi:predicted ATPase/DNA-binding SARP family transcriptional activator